VKYLITLSVVLLTACAGVPNASLETDKTVVHMTRSQVILAINECESAGTRPVVVEARRKINGVTTTVPVEVTCHPKYKFF
jgi:hypothetical protein